MIDQWFKQDTDFQLSHGNRAVVLDPNGQCGFLLSLLETMPCTVIHTDPALTEQWQTVAPNLEHVLRLPTGKGAAKTKNAYDWATNITSANIPEIFNSVKLFLSQD